MFALEINFHDGVSQPEVILVRRPYAILGSSDYAHVVVEGSGGGLFELRLSRGIGREFRCQKLGRTEGSGHQHLGESSYQGEAEIDLGDVSTHITSLDTDLQLQPGESPDLAGLRILRRALNKISPEFPAVMMAGATPVFVSFSPDEPVLVGRSRKCSLRLDASDVSAEHARFGSDGGRFWVEDLGSTNGTFVNGERVKGRRILKTSESVTVGGDYTFCGVASLAEVDELARRNQQLTVSATAQPEYPALVSKSDLVRPPRLVLVSGSRYQIGRDPACDIWVGAAHVSRNHAEIVFDGSDGISVVDVSSNGTRLNGQRLEHGKPVQLSAGVNEIDLGAGVLMAIVRNRGEESRQEGGQDTTSPAAHETNRDAGYEGAAAGNASRDRRNDFGNSRSERAGQSLAQSASAAGAATGAAAGLLGAGLRPEVRATEGGSVSSGEGSGNGVFEKLAQRAASQSGAPGVSAMAATGRFPTSSPSNLGSGAGSPSGFPKPANSGNPNSSTAVMDLGDEESAVVSRFGRAVLAFAITALAIVLLFLVWWFLGNANLFS